MAGQLFNRGKVNRAVIVAAPHYEPHIMALFGQFCIQDSNVGSEVFVSVSFHDGKIDDCCFGVKGYFRRQFYRKT